ncbi:MAG: MBL fold metallo-hydrolase [Ectothiorhodospiraceae bacterium]|nr:MBL fold metallo-hydrolase [Ectothiorhodospiraceae bacterium]
METPSLFEAREVAADIFELPACMPVPGLGALSVNAYLIRGTEPVLVDTGLAALGERFVEELETLVDPDDLAWIWLSHMDADHVGNLTAVLRRAPKARVVTNFLGMGKMMLAGLPVERVHVMEPGASLQLPDREIVPLHPPYYDAPETIGFFDTTASVLFTADAFGALLEQPARGDAAAIPPARLRDGLVTWAGIDAPWLSLLEPASLERSLDDIRRLAPTVVLSSHLPAASGITEALLGYVSEMRSGGTPRMPNALTMERLLDRAHIGKEAAI